MIPHATRSRKRNLCGGWGLFLSWKERTRVPITGDMSILEVMLKYPCTDRVFAAHGVACGGCMAAVEAVATGAQMHSVNIHYLLTELNQAIEGPKQTSLNEPRPPS